jgi:predicted ester cyclase
VCQWVEQIWNAGDLDQLSQFHPATFANHGNPMTIAETRQWHLRNRSTFPDIHYTIADLFATADRVALRWSATATHQGALWNLIPATGKTITWHGMHLLRLANQQIVEVWAVQDTIAQLQQMGVTLRPAGEKG